MKRLTDSEHEWMIIYILVVGMLVTAILFGLGHVEEKTSYGLREIIETIKNMGGIIVGYKFGKTMSSTPSEKEKNDQRTES